MKHGKIELLNMDCMDFMRGCKDKQFDLAIVDPPYGIAQDGHRENNRSKLAVSKKYHKALWDQDRPTKEYFIELERVSKNQIVWGGNHLADLIGKFSPCWLVWNKLNGDNHFADSELAYTSFKTAVRQFTFMWNGMLQGDMKNKQERIHPTEKPVQLYKWILKNYAGENFQILDTHLGSGSIAIACADYGFSLTGTELDKDYYDAACKRFRNHVAQTKLFA